MSDLRPAALLYIYKEDGRTIIVTDTNDVGIGDSLNAALDDMHKTSAGEVFLDTVDYVLVTEQTKNCIPELMQILRPSANLVMATGEIDVKSASEFLAIHRSEISLKDYMQEAQELPKMMTVGERYYLEPENRGK